MALGGVPVLECLYAAACGRYLCKRCWRPGYKDSKDWSQASYEEFEPVPRMCRVVLAVYEEDLSKPQWAPEGGYRMDLESVLKRVTYADTQGCVPPYLIYIDHTAHDIVLAIRGLSFWKEKDYATLLDDKLGKEPFDNGFVHPGLLRAAKWLLQREAETLKGLFAQYPSYTLSVAGHSLGSGVAAMFIMLAAKETSKLGNITRSRLRCYAIAPPRCMSLNLALVYADVIFSVILQDDFLPRTLTPLEDIFKSIFCLPCLICSRCTKDTFMSERSKLIDPRRLYSPGSVLHIVDRNRCWCGLMPPFVRKAVPVEGRFEHVIFSCNAPKDHSIIRIEKESQRALEILRAECNTTEPPRTQKMSKKRTFNEHHKAALEKAHSLQVPNMYPAHNNEERLTNDHQNNNGSTDMKMKESIDHEEAS